MNSETDRITVPTNGRNPHAVAEAPAPATVDPAAVDPAAEDAADESGSEPAGGDPVAKVTSPELTIAVTPAQLAVGFGVIAGIILLVVGRRHGRRRG
jgi:hypothetical protein